MQSDKDQIEAMGEYRQGQAEQAAQAADLQQGHRLLGAVPERNHHERYGEAEAGEREQGTPGSWGMLPAEEVDANREAGYEVGQ